EHTYHYNISLQRMVIVLKEGMRNAVDILVTVHTRFTTNKIIINDNQKPITLDQSESRMTVANSSMLIDAFMYLSGQSTIKAWPKCDNTFYGLL
ncbi:MAG TPA: hypothetical protein VIR31_07645, partial [Nitrososphaeraceae archaeon]